METETIECTLCDKQVTEVCDDFVCRKCHKSIGFDDCIAANTGTPEESRDKKRALTL